MKRVVVTGSECTGKTTLAEALGRHFHAAWVPEYARRFVIEKGAPPVREDVAAIARGQIALEDETSRKAPPVLIQDTDLLSTVVYARHYYGDCPAWIEDDLRRRSGHLYLLAHIDVPWTPDGDLRDRGHLREELQALFHRALVDRGLRFIEVRGPHERRMALATRSIEELLART